MQGTINRNNMLGADEATLAAAHEAILISRPDISNLANCVEEVRRATLNSSITEPADPTDFHQLRGRLEAVRAKFPPIYRESVVNPFIQTLDQLGPDGFRDVLVSDPHREGAAALMFDIAQAILQNGEGYQERATDAFQEVISDLYDGFLSAEDRRGVKPPDHSIIPALGKWGRPEFGPYTWPIDATSVFGLEAAIVNLPPVNATQGLLAWSAIPHEVTGHDILHADEGLLEELSAKVRSALLEQNAGNDLAEYWATRIDETASDILGILNLGPAAAVGLIGYFRGLNAAYAAKPALRNSGPASDPHPADILRGYMGAYAVGMLRFSQAREWKRLLEQEVDKDLTTIRLNGVAVNTDEAKRSAKIVATTIMKGKLASLEYHSLDEIQNWRNKDERIVALLRPLLTTAGTLPAPQRSGIYAAHVVAAAVTEAVSKNAEIDVIFDRMITLLKTMHDGNPSWGPLYVQHPGNLDRHLLYHRAEEEPPVYQV
ncbi:hypothetical protein [Brevibacillus dissolubilis]|uniref:hypothetical protein n=1 Tax=Brevibacillus dissolubilis TaxID=1844116 RepID=UPI00210022DF|nr:hypothetical protein [Brevibacillus dissolubilis]